MAPSIRIPLSLPAIAIAAATILLTARPACADGALPQVSNLQGICTDRSGHRLPDGTITLTLRFYTLPSGGTMLYAEQFLNVPIRSGIFNVQMGGGTPMAGGTFATFAAAVRGSSQVFAEPAVNADPAMAPRIALLSAPFAIRANSADYLGTLAAGQYLDQTSAAQTKAGPLTLTASTASGIPLLDINQTGPGFGVRGSGQIGLMGFTDSGGGGVFGRATNVFSSDTYGIGGMNDGPVGAGVLGSILGNGTATTADATGVSGNAGYPYLNHPFDYAAGVRGQSSVGDGVQGATTRGAGVYGFSNNTGVYGEAVYNSSVYAGTTWGVHGVTDTTNSVGVGGDSSTGIGVMGRSTSLYGVVGRSETGVAVRGQSQSGSGPGTGVEGSAGTGTGVNGIATAAGGVALRGSAHGADGVALQVDNGPMKVSGAAPTAFVAIAPTYAGTTWFAIDNPNCNGDPRAMLIVTPTVNPDGRTEVVYDAHPIAVYYDTSRSKWLITNSDNYGMPTHAAFNVLVIKK